MTTSRELEALARAHIQAENDRDLDKIMSTVGTGKLHFHFTSTGEVCNDVESVRGFYHRFATSLPDVCVTPQSVITDVDRRRVAIEFRFTGQVRSPIWGLAPHRKPLDVNGVVLYTFDANGKVIEEITYVDKADVMSSMGLIVDTRTEVGRFLLFLFQSPLYALKCAWYWLWQK